MSKNQKLYNFTPALVLNVREMKTTYMLKNWRECGEWCANRDTNNALENLLLTIDRMCSV